MNVVDGIRRRLTADSSSDVVTLRISDKDDVFRCAVKNLSARVMDVKLCVCRLQNIFG